MFEIGERVRIAEDACYGTVVQNLWGLDEKTMMVEIQFADGSKQVVSEQELIHADSITLAPIKIALADAIDMLSNECHEIARDHGFWEEAGECTPRMFMMARVALIHSEASELLEEIRKDGDRRSQMEEEIADILIRCFDFCGGYGLDLGKAVIEKMEKNRSRPHMHGKRA